VAARPSVTADGRGVLGITCEPFLSRGCFDRRRRWGWQIPASIRAVNRFFRPHPSRGADQDTTASADERGSQLSPNSHRYPILRYGWEIVASRVRPRVDAGTLCRAGATEPAPMAPRVTHVFRHGAKGNEQDLQKNGRGTRPPSAWTREEETNPPGERLPAAQVAGSGSSAPRERSWRASGRWGKGRDGSAACHISAVPRAADQAATPSWTPVPTALGVTPTNRNPPLAKRAAYSAGVRSWPMGPTSMLRSENLGSGS
jgi:hypothetical protein